MVRNPDSRHRLIAGRGLPGSAAPTSDRPRHRPWVVRPGYL